MDSDEVAAAANPRSLLKVATIATTRQSLITESEVENKTLIVGMDERQARGRVRVSTPESEKLVWSVAVGGPGWKV